MRRTGFVGQACCALRAEECGGAGAAGEAGEEGSRGRGKERGGEPEATSGSIAASEDEKWEPNRYVLESRAGLSGEVGGDGGGQLRAAPGVSRARCGQLTSGAISIQDLKPEQFGSELSYFRR